MRKFLYAPAFVALLVLFPARDASAEGDFVADWRANYPDACTTLYQLAQDCTLCHGGGFSLNVYGAALAGNGIDYDVVGLLDSDEDGRTNDQEINIDCTVPADAVSPAAESTWGNVKALFD